MSHRLSAVRDLTRRSFWFLPGAGILLAIGLGLGLPALDEALEVEVDLPFFTLEDRGAVRGLLETVATVTVSVAGISFSVTVVALQLASQQLSPRVLRTFQTDRLSQVTMAVFLGTFVYSLLVLASFRLEADAVPKLSATAAVLGSIAAFLLFVAFIHNIVVSLQASTLIRRIAADGHHAVETRYPDGIGFEPADPQAAAEVVARRRAGARREVGAPRAGYLVRVEGETVMGCAAQCDGMVTQRAELGDFVLSGMPLADVWGDGDLEAFAGSVQGAFVQEQERAVVQDVAFPIRQLSDIALRGLSPSLNDPTTAENAMDSLADTLLVFVRAGRVSLVRVDGEQEPRFVASAPDLDGLVRLGFEQVRVKAAAYPTVARRLAALLEAIEECAREAGCACPEAARQRRLLAEGVGGNVPTEEDAAAVRSAAGGAAAP